MSKGQSPKVKKVYLPKWVFWATAIMMVVLLVFFNISYFTNPQNKAEMGAIGWIALNLVFVICLAMVYLMSYGKLPAYIIKEEEEEAGPESKSQ